MALFFDAPWFDARLVEHGLDRGDLAACAGLSREDLHGVITHQREPSAAELTAFASLLGADIVEITLRSGVSTRVAAADDATRLDDLDARLDRIDKWLNDLSEATHVEREEGSPGLSRVAARR